MHWNILQYLNPLLPNVPFWSPWKREKTRSFLMFSGGVKREHWQVKGWILPLMLTALFFHRYYYSRQQTIFNVFKRLFLIEYGVVPVKKYFPNSNWINGNGRKRVPFITPIRKTLQEASKACQELVKYSCKKNCNTGCKCKTFKLSCRELCMCSGGFWMANWTKIFCNVPCYWNREHDIASRCLLLF